MPISISSNKISSGADMSLDDIIKKKKSQKQGARGQVGLQRGTSQKKGGNLRGTRNGGINKQNRRRQPKSKGQRGGFVKVR